MVINESLAHIYAGTTAAPALRQPLIHSHSRRHRHATLLAAVLMWDHRLLVNRCSAEWKGERPEIICLTWSSSQLSRWEEGRKRACVRVFFLCAVVLSVCVWRQVRVSLHLPQLQTLNLLVWVTMTCGKQNLLHPFHPASCHFLPNPSSVPRPPPPQTQLLIISE